MWCPRLAGTLRPDVKMISWAYGSTRSRQKPLFTLLIGKSAPPDCQPAVSPCSKAPLTRSESRHVQLSVVATGTAEAPSAGDWSIGAGTGAACKVIRDKAKTTEARRMTKGFIDFLQ